ncbi:AraC family transcriptional regulator [Sphingobacterium sp. DN00404]|uniref:AraC family transcriptional regulator n=1 Tax=Sphingobacterium micropteri TaxID=2763501 RepID=A0ABR7YUD0_9SPHI|nr:helix-turn-helix domain-containing protein [Sphingobacterium micropteri]MBD1434892.1 AraC family transcriptional regulator [Sphingobacterium micropteri]
MRRQNDVVYQQLKTEHIVGAYVFPCKDLRSNQPLFNDGLPSLIFMPRKSDAVRLNEKGEATKFNAAWVCCGVIKNTYWEVPSGLEYILVLRFKPSSFYSIFKVDPSAFHARPIRNLADILDENWMQIFDKMYEKKILSERISFLDDVFSSFKTDDCFPHILSTAVEYIEAKKGNITVSDVLHKLGKKVNSKWLHRNFVKYIGISPKKYISLQRFIYTYGQYEKSKSENLFDLALISGYYDYNHFFKDFKQYIGVAPSKYAWE